MKALESKVTTLHQKLAQLEEKREQDRERMEKYKAKIAHLKEAVYERSRNPWLLWLRRFFAPSPRSVIEEEGR